jgi:hypothetical protein
MMDQDAIRLRREVSLLLEEQRRMRAQIAQLQGGTSVTPETTTIGFAGDNILRNCQAQFSDDAYNNLGAGGDAALRAAHWAGHAAATTLLGFASGDLLKAPTHSAYAADDPDWDPATGQLRLGSTKTISQELVNRYVQRDLTLFFQFDATLRTATALPGGLIFYAGFWDNTAGQEKWVGGTPTLTIAVVGTPGATTRQYRVIVTTDTGDQYQIDATAITNAPNLASTINYVRISWPPVSGRISARIEKLQGGVFALLGTIVSGSTDFNDYGNAGTVIGAFSTATTTLSARIEDGTFAPEFGLVRRYGYAIRVPTAYNMAVTTVPHVLRFGLSAALPDVRQLLLTRFQLGFSSGAFQPSAFDLAVTNATTVTTPPEPAPPEEDPPCFCEYMPVVTPDGLRTFSEMEEAGDSGLQIVNGTGTHDARLLVHEFQGTMIDLGYGLLVTLDHLFEVIPGVWRRANDEFPENPRVEFKGKVYNLEVLSTDPADHVYLIVINGTWRVVHNRKIAYDLP